MTNEGQVEHAPLSVEAARETLDSYIHAMAQFAVDDGPDYDFRVENTKHIAGEYIDALVQSVRDDERAALAAVPVEDDIAQLLEWFGDGVHSDDAYRWCIACDGEPAEGRTLGHFHLDVSRKPFEHSPDCPVAPLLARLRAAAGAEKDSLEGERRAGGLLKEMIAEAVAFLDGGALTFEEQRTLRDGLARALSDDDLASKAEGERRALAALREAAGALAEGAAVITTCRCDEAWTKRGRHESNAICGDLDDEIAAVRALLEPSPVPTPANEEARS